MNDLRWPIAKYTLVKNDGSMSKCTDMSLCFSPTRRSITLIAGRESLEELVLYGSGSPSLKVKGPDVLFTTNTCGRLRKFRVKFGSSGAKSALAQCNDCLTYLKYYISNVSYVNPTPPTFAAETQPLDRSFSFGSQEISSPDFYAEQLTSPVPAVVNRINFQPERCSSQPNILRSPLESVERSPCSSSEPTADTVSSLLPVSCEQETQTVDGPQMEDKAVQTVPCEITDAFVRDTILDSIKDPSFLQLASLVDSVLNNLKI